VAVAVAVAAAAVAVAVMMMIILKCSTIYNGEQQGLEMDNMN
jgi:hypothetical protein